MRGDLSVIVSTRVGVRAQQQFDQDRNGSRL